MKINKIIGVAFSDLHLHRYKNYNEGNRRLKNGIDVIKTIALVCKKYRAIGFFIGDLFHTEKNLTNEIIDDTFPPLMKLFNRFDIYAISGNHDQSQQNMIGKESPSYIKTLAKMTKMECLDFTMKEVPNTNIRVYGIPYITHDMGLVEYIKKIKTSPAYKNVLMLHTTLPGAKDTDDREVHSHLDKDTFHKVIENFDLVLCGHIHKPFKYKVGNTLVVNVGAPQQQRLTDKNCKMGYWLIYDNLSVEFVHLSKYPKFIEIENLNQKVDNKDFYVLTVKKKNIIKSEKVNNEDFSNTLDKSELAKNYCKTKGIKDKDKRKALRQSLNNTES